ncbi:MAG: hypothetical protein AAB502_05450, partial [Chloroflexota bacterium]
MPVRDRLRILGRSIAQGPVAYVAAAALGVIAAALVFYYVAPGRPYVGIVRLPYFEIDDYSTAQIEDVLRFAERD